MDFKKLNKQDFLFFIELLGKEYVYSDNESLDKYSRDYTEDLSFLPEIVLLPNSVDLVSAILAYCNKERIPVTPRGAGTSLSGGALPLYGGVVLSTEKMNRIINIDTSNFQVITEPGVINQTLRDALAEVDLFYPPDPASKGTCFIGGNVAHSSGGPKALKYGTTKDYVLNLQLVLADGSVIWTGANTLKNSTGYNLTHLVVGSEGTLGIVTQIVLKVIPLPKYQVLLVASFNSVKDACATVSPVFMNGLQPSAVELLDQKGVSIAVKAKSIENPFPECACFLMIEFDGNKPEAFQSMCELAYETCLAHNAVEVLMAETAAEQEKFWNIRRSIGEVVKTISIYKEEDTVVPRAALPQVIEKVQELEKEYGFNAVCYGHAGDGNLHINILKEDMDDHRWEKELPKAIRQLFETCKALGGTISGEHGIGYVQKAYMDVMLDKTHFLLFAGIKNTFDPNGILNPGKIFDPA